MPVILSRMFFRDTTISLTPTSENGYQWRLTYAGKPSPLNQTLERWPELNDIQPFFTDENDAVAAVALDELESAVQIFRTLQTELSHFRKLIFELPEPIASYRFYDPAPEDVELHCIWTDSGLCCVLPDGVEALPNGWYRRDNDFWKYRALDEHALEQLRRPCIPGEQAVAFLTKEVPAYQAAGVNLIADVHYDRAAVLELAFESLETEKIVIRKKWRVPLSWINASAKIPGHVLAYDTIRPGVMPEALSALFPSSPDAETHTTLSGVQIAEFHEQYYGWLKPWFVGDCTAFEQMHRWVEPPYEWILRAEATVSRGIGTAYAHPSVRIGGEDFSVSALRDLLKTPYARIRNGWVRRRDLCTLGMDGACRLSDGRALTPEHLNMAALINRGNAGLEGPWQRMEMAGLPWRTSPIRQEAAREHLEFLLYWGMNGGLTGGFEAASVYGRDLITSYQAQVPDARLLIVGVASDLHALERQFPDWSFQEAATCTAEVRGLFAAPYDALPAAPTLRDVQWDLVILIEPDAWLRTPDAPESAALLALPSRLRIGFFRHDVSEPDLKLGFSYLIGDQPNDPMLPYRVRDIGRPIFLPPPYAFHPTAPTPVPEVQASTAWNNDAVTGGAVIQCHERPLRIGVNHACEVNFKMACDTTPAPAALSAPHPAPFHCHWPTRLDMSEAQLAFYKSLCVQWDNGQFPEADRSYLYAYIYEKLALVGVDGPRTSYGILLDVWYAYRACDPTLDAHMSQWLFDFVHLYPLPDVDYATDAFVLCPMGQEEYWTNRPEEPLTLSADQWDEIIGYRSRPFCTSGHRAQMDRLLPPMMELLDGVCRADGGILGWTSCTTPQTWTVEAFEDAVVPRLQRYTWTGRAFLRDATWRARLTDVVLYVECELRRRLNDHPTDYEGSLDPLLIEFINEYLDSVVLSLPL